jgi:hypothetical protein
MENCTLEGMVNVSDIQQVQQFAIETQGKSHYVQNHSKRLPVCVLHPLMTTEIIINKEYSECN